MSVHIDNTKKVTTKTFQDMKVAGEKITMLTSYDYSLASIVDAAGIDAILVGDSASNVVCGNMYTLPITLDEMIFLAKGVVRAAHRAMVIMDMPFGSYQVSESEAVANAVRAMKETGADGLKIEGGEEWIDTITHICRAGIPVMGHLGLTPQSVNQFGGYGLRAKEEAEANKLINDAKLLEKAGCFSITLEKIPSELAKRVAQEVSIPIIGIGAGHDVDGQVLVLHDMLGITKGFKPKFLRQFAQLEPAITDAVGKYIEAVKGNDFPNQAESY